MDKLGKHSTLVIILLVAAVIVFIQLWATLDSARRVDRIVSDLASLRVPQIQEEKTRQELISLRIQNETKALFWNGMLTALAPMIPVVGALFAGWFGLRKYLDARNDERLDQAAVEMRQALENLVSAEPIQRAVGVVGLQHYLTDDKKEYHLRALSALVTASRLEQNKEVNFAIRIAVEQAVRRVDEIVLQRVSWQRVKLIGANLSGCKLRALDFRDADLENANLVDSDLSGTSFENARLKGADLDRCILQEANLAYADFAGASLAGADLTGAVLYHAKVMDLDLKDAILTDAQFYADMVQWELTKNWRSALLDHKIRDELIELYGREPSGPRVLMLMWEIPPLVAGGTWTACYHAIRNLRRRGADVTVVVPWDLRFILPRPFGCEVNVVPLGIVPPRSSLNAYSTSWSPYSSYSQIYGSPYSGSSSWSSWMSPYGTSSFYSPYASYLGPYTSYSTPGRAFSPRSGSTLLRLTDEFKKRFLRYAEHQRFDVIHAHDWVTFEAAETAAARLGKPWIAHFHSTERDRRPQTPDNTIERIESRAATADQIIVPSGVTRSAIVRQYGIAQSKITVTPNSLSREEIELSEMGNAETKRVIFLGRLAEQKGPDLFAKLASEVRQRRSDVSFWIYGDGPLLDRLRGSWAVNLAGPLDWSSRGSAFENATAVVVPSRSEPFGMVVLEAMQHRVPVLYPEQSGVAEVINKGIRIRPDDIAGTVSKLLGLIDDTRYWEETVEAQYAEVVAYIDGGHEEAVIQLWNRVTGAAAGTPTVREKPSA